MAREIAQDLIVYVHPSLGQLTLVHGSPHALHGNLHTIIAAWTSQEYQGACLFQLTRI